MRQLPAPSGFGGEPGSPQVLPLQPAVQQDEELSLAEIWHVLRRRWLLVATTTAVVVAAAMAYAFRAAPVYEAVTSIRIDQKESNLPVLDVLKELSSGNEVATEMQVLQSRTLAQDVVDSLGLQVQVRRPKGVTRDALFSLVNVSASVQPGRYTITRSSDGGFTIENTDSGTVHRIAPGAPMAVPGMTLVSTAALDTIQQVLLDVQTPSGATESLLKELKVTRPDREANLVVVTYRSRDLDFVREVPNQLARRFITQRRDVQQTEARSTAKFLREQIDTIGRQLTVAEDQLRTYREGANVVSVADEATTEVTHLADLQAERTSLDAERGALASLWSEIQVEEKTRKPGDPSPYRRLAGFPSLLKNQATATLLGSLANIEDERAALRVRRTEADPDVKALEARIDDINLQLAGTATAYLQGLTNQVAAMDSSLAQFSGEMKQIPAKETELARLERQPKVLNEIYELLQTRLKEAEIAQAVEDATVRVIDVAVVPPKPVSPNKPLLLILGVVGGLLLGIGIAFLREHMDRTIHTREDVYAITGLPVLGLIPRIAPHRAVLANVDRLKRIASSFGDEENGNGKNGNGKNHLLTWTPAAGELGERLVAGANPRSPVSEAYRALRTSLTFARPDNPVKTIVFTSPMPGDGKTTSAANFAITLAQQGIKTLLIDADLRRGVLNTVLGTAREPGLSNVLLGSTPVESAIASVDLGEHGSIDFLSTGTMPPNPAELLGSDRMRVLMATLKDQYQHIVIDAPPLNVVTDAAVVGTYTDGVVVVARAATTESGALAYTVDVLDQVRVPILGVILNDIDFKRDSRYSPRYGQYYGYSGQYGQAYAPIPD